MIFKVSCISVAYNAAFMSVNGPITLPRPAGGSRHRDNWGGGGEGELKKNFSRSLA